MSLVTSGREVTVSGSPHDLEVIGHSSPVESSPAETPSSRADCERQRLHAIAAAANASGNLDEILLLIRNAVIEAGGFDRAGILLSDYGVLCGTWGTDESGRLRDESEIRWRPEELNPCLARVARSEVTYCVEDVDTRHDARLSALTTPRQVTTAAVGLYARGRLIGVISADNLLTGRPIVAAEIEALLPFFEQTAMALSTARLLEERDRLVRRQQRLMQICAAINGSQELDEILRMVRDAVIEAGGFDRAGVWLTDGETIQGSWGTDREGRPREERHISQRLADWGLGPVQLCAGPRRYYVENKSAGVLDDEEVRPHAIVKLITGGETVGLLCVDNLITRRPVKEEEVLLLLPFAEHAAVAIRNARLRTETIRNVERQRRLASLAAAIGASTALHDILRMVRDAVVEAGGFDRAGVFLYDAERKELRGTWGTSRDGEPIDIADRRLPVSETSAASGVQVVLGKLPYCISRDYSADAPPQGEMRGVRYHAVVALRTGGETLGVICVDNLLRDAPITEADVLGLVPFADHAAVAIQKARLIEERDRQIERQRRLASLAAAIGASTALHDILRMVRDAVIEAGGFDRAGVYLYDPHSHELTSSWGTERDGRPQLDTVRFVAAPDDKYAGVRALFDGSRYALTENYTGDVAAEPGHAMYGVRHHGAVTMRAGGEVVGVIFVDNALTDRPITEDQLTALIPFADQTAVAIQNARLFKELHEAQEALLHSEKLRALGELAGGVAHNVNNVLTAVLGYAELIQHDEQATPQIAHFARVIERAALDGADIARRMQHFARAEAEKEFAPFDLSIIAQEAIDLTRPAWQNLAAATGRKIAVETSLPDSLPARGLASEIREVLINLIKNAVDAMPQGGEIRIAGRREDGDVILEVADNGLGMDEATRRRIFEPFFTTKGAGLGVGLGLAVAWGIVSRHNGRIDLQTAPGEGAAFSLVLPASDDLPAAEAPAPPASLAGIRILLVEDEEAVAETLGRQLSSAGAVLEMAYDAGEALEWLTASSSACDLILTDHGMIGMTGCDLLRTVRERHPHVRRVLISGWGDNLRDEPGADAAELVLTKPVRRSVLTGSLAQLFS